MTAVLPRFQNPREYKWMTLFVGVDCHFSLRCLNFLKYGKRRTRAWLLARERGRLYKAECLLLLSSFSYVAFVLSKRGT